MRYYRQKDKYSCGPVAVGNALKHNRVITNYTVNKKKIEKLCKLKPTGCKKPPFVATVRKYFSKVRVINKPTLTQINEAISKGKGIMFRNSYIEKGKKYGHLSFCYGYTKSRKFYKFVNYLRGRTLSNMPKKHMVAQLRRPDTWIVTYDSKQ